MKAGKEGQNLCSPSRPQKIVIVGAGPAGSSLAIRLAHCGFPVTLVEREKFPREKLCGEFISPECLRHFGILGVLEEMLSCGGARIAETRFYEAGGRNVAVPSDWFGGEALSLSRSAMDAKLLEEAKACGVQVLEETSAIGFEAAGPVISCLKLRGTWGVGVLNGDLYIDATGRSRVLARLIVKQGEATPSATRMVKLVGFKAHFIDAKIKHNRCEIYGFPGGYGGLSPIEDGLANYCFITNAEIVRRFAGNADALVEEVVRQNRRAEETLRTATPASPWLAVSIDRFGAANLRPAANVFTIGDAAAFIDPFTGSGMLMAFQSAALFASLFKKYGLDLEDLGRAYSSEHHRLFGRRLMLSSWLRRAAMVPGAAAGVVALLSISSAFRRLIAGATRGTAPRIDEI